MIDLTPLDVRKKKGDFRRGLRGYEPSVVDDYLDLVAERLEELVRENAALRERTAQMESQISAFRERESAMNEALVSAQQLREEVRQQAEREAELKQREARSEAQRILQEAKRQALSAADSTRRVHTQRAQYIRSFRAFVERQLAEIEMEEERLRDPTREAAEGPADAAPPAPSGTGDEVASTMSDVGDAEAAKGEASGRGGDETDEHAA